MKEVRSARVDAVGYAELVSGIRFQLRDEERTLQRWRETVAALRAAVRPRPAGGEAR